MAINFDDLTILQKQCVKRIINLPFGQGYVSANFGAISDAFYAIEYKDEYGNAPPAFIGKPTYGFTEIRTTDFPMPLLNRTVNKLVEQGFLERIYKNDDDFFQLSDEFVEEAHRIFLDGSATFRDDVPAADRFVSIRDNQLVVEETRESLAVLSQAIRGANDLFATQEDRIQISEQIDYLRELISKPKLHCLSLWDAARNNHTLQALAEQIKSNFVQQAAKLVLLNLDKLVSFALSFITKN